ncbi:hypothetical protein KP509_08G064300 [Ceratopteris richardii]|uniref:Uncharacterized protein n=1 Tax=Ceratopteris richardii TaxID=49495 RepID=A0A8T2UAN3_CERRI|nr:hypothetical protein KP509_08G064300 [Ceratopteris richardii]
MDFEHSLLCYEENISSPLASDFTDFTWLSTSPETISHVHSSTPMFFLDEDKLSIPFLLSKQEEYKPDPRYAKDLAANKTLSEARSNAACWMIKAHFSHKFTPTTVAMAMNYLDRYLQKRLDLPWRPWMMELLSVACLSIAAKMEEVEVPALLDLQFEGLSHLFQPKTVQRMELTILSEIGWKLRCVTPFTFIDKAINHLEANRHLKQALILRVSELLLGAISGSDFLRFDYSVLACTTMFFAFEELIPHRSAELKISLLQYVPIDEEKSKECCALMESLVVDPVYTSLSLAACSTKSPLSPKTVLSPYEDCSSLESCEDLHFHLPHIERKPDSLDDCALRVKRRRRG